MSEGIIIDIAREVVWTIVKTSAPLLIISLIIGLIISIFQTVTSIQEQTLTFVPKFLAIMLVLVIIANVFMNFVLVYVIGVQGATIATVISSFVIYFFRKKAVGSDININGYWKILLTWGLLCTQAIVEIYTNLWYNYN